jgi:hypothetical protein
MKIFTFRKTLLAGVLALVSASAADARPRLFARRCAGGGCGQVQAVQPVYQQQWPVAQSLGNVVQAVGQVPVAVMQRVAAPVMPASYGGCPGGVCPIR